MKLLRLPRFAIFAAIRRASSYTAWPDVRRARLTKLGQLKLRTNTLANLSSRTRYARAGAALGEGVRCPIMG
jgi:hypothetical protein